MKIIKSQDKRTLINVKETVSFVMGKDPMKNIYSYKLRYIDPEYDQISDGTSEDEDARYIILADSITIASYSTKEQVQYAFNELQFFLLNDRDLFNMPADSSTNYIT